MRETRNKYLINEIFYSLQGEGRWTGKPMVFVRFSGCNLRCEFCDTDFKAFTEMSLQEIVDTVASLSGTCRNICVTGGEPSLQITQEFVDRFHKEGYKIHIETNGTHPLPQGIDWITCSPKETWERNADVVLEYADEIKLVYTEQDPEKWLDFNAKYHFLQPCSCRNTEKVIQYILNHPKWQLSLQTHKYTDIR